MTLHEQIRDLTRRVKQQDGIITPSETRQLAELLLIEHTKSQAFELQLQELRLELRDVQQTLLYARCNLT